jgi:hypothetical protein
MGKLSTLFSRSELLSVFDYCCVALGTESAQVVGISAFAELLFGTDRDDRDRETDRDDRPKRSANKKLTRSDESDLKDSVARLFTKRRDLVDSLISMVSVTKSKGVSLADVSAQCEKMDSDGNGYIPKFDFLDAFTRAGIKFKSDFERDFVDSVAEAQAGVLSGLTGKSSNIAYDSVIRAIEAEIRAEDEAEEVLDKLRRKIAREIKHPAELEDVSTCIKLDAYFTGPISSFRDSVSISSSSGWTAIEVVAFLLTSLSAA